MHLVITKSFFKEIIERYTPEPESDQEVDVDDIVATLPTDLDLFKKALLEDIMVLIDKHLHDAFLKFYT
jgi:hypothetical protein